MMLAAPARPGAVIRLAHIAIPPTNLAAGIKPRYFATDLAPKVGRTVVVILSLAFLPTALKRYPEFAVDMPPPLARVPDFLEWLSQVAPLCSAPGPFRARSERTFGRAE
jgi:hypothetical protein